MKAADLASYVQQHIEPLPAHAPYGERYRVACRLTDGTELPCVVIEGADKTVDLAIKRFDDTRKSNDPYMGYRAIVANFVTNRNSVNNYDIAEVFESPFAIPLARLREIKGETSMSWTAFTARMSDGQEFRFGTTFTTEFFNMPAGFKATDIVHITPAPAGSHWFREPGQIYRERPFFTCFVNGLR